MVAGSVCVAMFVALVMMVRREELRRCEGAADEVFRRRLAYEQGIVRGLTMRSRRPVPFTIVLSTAVPNEEPIPDVALQGSQVRRVRGALSD